MDGPYLQRRFLVSFASRKLPHIFTDVLVVGSGAAGMRAAIEASGAGSVIVLTKGELRDSNTYNAQGGLAAVLDASDTIESHLADTIEAGRGMCDEAVIRRVIEAAPHCIREMYEQGLEFDSSGQDLALGREGGHSASRIVHAAGDASGRVLVDFLAGRIAACEEIKVFEDCFAIDLVTDPPEGGSESRCIGALTYNPRYGLQMIHARRTILAAGGSGMLWRETSNPPGATADAIALAFRAGVTISDVEMMQFHPTTLYIAGSSRSLISEAVRGEGAYLVDRNGERFMPDCHELAELAPRDTVSRAILTRMRETGSTHVFLDVRHIGGKAFSDRFPQINQQCKSFGIDPGCDLIPVHPAAHYMIGGASVDMDGRTSVEGLLACGEAACTGMHGANRLASNSLTEALVLGRQCGRLAGEIASSGQGRSDAPDIDWMNEKSERTELDLSDIRSSLRSVMWRNVGLFRRRGRLEETLEIIAFWGRYVLDKEFYDPAGWEAQNMLTASYVISRFALRRTETRGVHCREDYPETDPSWARHQTARRTDEELVIE
ncbi:MAG: L-aspartate oxidase [Phycisphaerae bacterium]|jgi:L-aspartate oxidase|nr:L-aspartate oxidase [Phycisphaerae bacterium]